MRILSVFLCVLVLASCNDQPVLNKAPDDTFNSFVESYYQQRMKVFPIEATLNGLREYNGKMYADFTESRRAAIRQLYTSTLDRLHRFNQDSLTENELLSYDYLDYFLPKLLKELDYKKNLIPTDQMWGVNLLVAQWAGGDGAQPFRTVEDYDLWLSRIHDFSGWLDSAVVYFKKGIAEKYTLPKPLVRSMIPEFEAMVTKDAKSNLFYAPIEKMPAGFPAADRARLTAAYTKMITDTLIPAYRKMSVFLKDEYLPAARETTTGISALSDGADSYRLAISLQTTTDKTADEIRDIGYREVARIRQEMEKIKQQVGFRGTLEAFFAKVRSDPMLMPYRTPEEVLNAFRSIQAKITPNLPKFFNSFPKTPFEIRRTEAFRENSASAEYRASPDNIEPGIFYIPIPDAKKFNIASGMESLFLHEAIPGHHYQLSIASEDTLLPSFRRRAGDQATAYVEGWALYCESLGKELGLYTDPYQHLGALNDEMHRAIRLVVDVSLHTGGMNREQAIKYMMSNETINEQGATAEIERYIAFPGQALAYKVGAMKIAELRDKYRQKLGAKFSIARFHDEVLKDGPLPLTVLEKKMDRWANTQ